MTGQAPTASPPWPELGTVSGLSGPVTITRGPRGVPEIQAAEYLDAVCGLGYATGRERLFQMDLARRRAYGRLAELAGPAAADADAVQRALGPDTVVAKAAAALPPRHRALVDAYTAGVNQAVADSPVPFEPRLTGADATEPWRVEDCLAVALLMAQTLSGDGADRRMRDVMDRVLPAELTEFLLPQADPFAVDLSGVPVARHEPSAEAVRALVAASRGRRRRRTGRPVVADGLPWGSNAAVVAGRHTADGRALLANDMHLALTAPTLFFRAALRWGRDRRVDGFVIPGLPVFVAGTTGELAWGATRLAADSVDLVEVDADPGDPERYRTTDGWSRLRTRTERVLVRGAGPREARIADTEWGPVTGTSPDGRQLALHWTVLEPGGLNLGLADLVEAPDVARAHDVVRHSAGAPLNVLFADRAGRIGWAVTGRHPQRVRDAPAGIVRPRDGQSTWSRHLDPSRLPFALDPPSGVIVNANNGVPEHRTTPPIAVNHFGGARAERLGALIRAASATPVTERDLYAAQTDQDAGFYGFYRDLVLEVLTPEAVAAGPDRGSLRAAVESWDGGARPSARGLPILTLFRELVRESWFACLLAPCLDADPEFRYCWHNHEAPLRALLCHPDLAPAPHRDRRAFLLAELDLCALLLRTGAPDTAPGDLRWGELNPSGVRHPLSDLLPQLSGLLDQAADAPGGCPESLCATRPGFGPALRLAASPGHPADALVALPGGQAGNPADPTYRDQFPAWLAGEPLPLLDPTGDAAVTELRPPSTGAAAACDAER